MLCHIVLNFIKQEEMESSSLVSNGRVDRQGRIADKRTTGGWKAAPFIISMITKYYIMKLDRIITMYYVHVILIYDMY